MKTEIIQKSSTIKKPNKAQAFEALARVIDEPNLDDLAKLYAFFLPPIPKKPKKDWQWVALAMASNKDVRHYLRWIYSDGKRLIATNGHRLHVLPDANLAPGYYNKALNLTYDLDYANYPEVDRITPDPEDAKATADAWRFIESCEVIPIGEKLAYKSPEGIGLNKQYLDQALIGLESPNIHLFEPNNAVLITDGKSDKYAVIMPVIL